MTRFLTLTVFIGIMYAVSLFRVPGTPYGTATLFLGFLLLVSYLAGRAARTVSLPQITGYLIIGIVVGPYVLGILPRDIVEEFRFVNGVALALIALSAGGELRLGSLRRQIRSIGTITTLQILFMFSFVAAFVFLARSQIGFLRGQPPRVALAVALLFGLVAVAKSPATTIAIITEERARGILTSTVLGITVVKDVIILILIALFVPLAAMIVNPTGGFNFEDVVDILKAILGSLVVGFLIGWLVTQYLKRISEYRILFILGVAFLAVYLGERLHMESILIAMSAGFYVQNFSRQGRRLIHALEANSLPIYAVFFAVAGANLNFSVLGNTWVFATAMILTRLAALWVSTYLGALIVNDPPAIRRHAWMGFVAQAGVTLGIANIIREQFPVWGIQVSTIIIGMIAVNQLLGPPAFRWALIRAGESHARTTRK